MKNTLLSIAIIFLTLSAYGQSVVISESGGAVPNSNAILDIQSDSKGILIPRLTKVQREGITTPPDGLLVFDTTEKAFFSMETPNGQTCHRLPKFGRRMPQMFS